MFEIMKAHITKRGHCNTHKLKRSSTRHKSLSVSMLQYSGVHSLMCFNLVVVLCCKVFAGIALPFLICLVVHKYKYRQLNEEADVNV